MKKEHWITTLSLIICWFLLSFWIGHDIILPSPLNVFESMKNQLFHSEFFSILFITGSRMMKGLMLAFLSSLILILIFFQYIQNKHNTLPNNCQSHYCKLLDSSQHHRNYQKIQACTH